MGNLYKNQALASINLNTGYDLSGSSNARIYYVKPDGTTKGYWNANIVGQSIVYDILDSTILDQSGKWKLESYMEIAGRGAFGDPTTITILNTIL